MLTRRDFIQQSAAMTAALALPHMQRQKPVPKYRTEFNVQSLVQFVDALPIPEIAKPLEMRRSPVDMSVKVPYYRISMKQTESKLHKDLKPTRVWTYGGSLPGPTIEARSGQGILVEWANELPTRHFLPIDHTIHGAEADKPEVRAVVHVHGAKVPPESDGYPENWFVPGKSATYFYPNRQDAAMLWYHDHTLGINRLNVFAGLLGSYIVRDDFEDALKLPSGKYEIPLLFFDRSLDLDHQLNYPVSGDAKSPWTPEVFCDAILINGKIFPYLEVEPRPYRFRMLNAANARFFHFWLSNGQKLQQIGTDQGLLPAPLDVTRVMLAPAERADVIVDFSAMAGKQITLQNDGIDIMQFRVSGKSAQATAGNAGPAARQIVAAPAVLRSVPKISEASAVKTRMLSLVEVDDLVQRPMTMLLNNAHWDMPITENPVLGTTEIWNLINTTDDAHPIHLHLVRFQILDRRAFNASAYWTEGKITYTAAAVLPEASETGWKDTVRADPGMVTRIIIPFEGYPGRYVWHCHILEHEDNEMMRPFEVVVK